MSGGNTGVHFMTIFSISDLRKKINDCSPVLLKDETDVYMLSSFDDMSKFVTYNKTAMKPY